MDDKVQGEADQTSWDWLAELALEFSVPLSIEAIGAIGQNSVEVAHQAHQNQAASSCCAAIRSEHQPGHHGPLTRQHRVLEWLLPQFPISSKTAFPLPRKRTSIERAALAAETGTDSQVTSMARSAGPVAWGTSARRAAQWNGNRKAKVSPAGRIKHIARKIATAGHLALPAAFSQHLSDSPETIRQPPITIQSTPSSSSGALPISHCLACREISSTPSKVTKPKPKSKPKPKPQASTGPRVSAIP
ncbi:hypothetical protein E4U55_007256 [Claviceps digitariae]|nr:hypothetical protein E4U55_007256 [Claviceps digitariae]